MISDIEKLLLLISDMEEMVNPEDDLSRTVLNSRKRNTELDLETLDLVSAAGSDNPDYSYNNYKKNDN